MAEIINLQAIAAKASMTRRAEFYVQAILLPQNWGRQH